MSSKCKKFLSSFEIYLGAILFAAMTFLLFMQVVSRYVFGHSFTWTEELCTIFFVWMVYLGCAGAITRRKHLCIDAFVTAVPFKVRKIMLIADDIIFGAFAIYIIFPMVHIVENYLSKGAASPILRLPKGISYAIMPVSFALIAIRLVSDVIRLVHENEEDLGKSEPTIDVAKLEAEAAANKLKKGNEA